MATKFLNGVDLASQRIVNLADPSSNSDAATKSYVDNSLAGLKWKAPVRVATTTNGTLATAYAAGQSVDGVTLVAGDRILVKDQTDAKENGIYVVPASGAPSRASDANTSAGLLNATVFVVMGTANADRAYTQTTNASDGTGPVIATDNIVFAQFGGGTAYSAGNGLSLASTTFSVQANGTSIDVSGSGIRVGTGAAGSGLTGGGASALSVSTGTASATGLELSGGNVRIATAAAGNGLTGGGGSALAIDTTKVARKYTTTIGDPPLASV